MNAKELFIIREGKLRGNEKIGCYLKKKKSFKNYHCFYFKGQLCFFVLSCFSSHQTAEKVMPVADFPWKGFAVSGDLKPVKKPCFHISYYFHNEYTPFGWTWKYCFYLFHIITWLFIIIVLSFDLRGVEIFWFSVSLSALVICTYKTRALASIMSGNC